MKTFQDLFDRTILETAEEEADAKAKQDQQAQPAQQDAQAQPTDQAQPPAETGADSAGADAPPADASPVDAGSDTASGDGSADATPADAAPAEEPPPPEEDYTTWKIEDKVKAFASAFEDIFPVDHEIEDDGEIRVDGKLEKPMLRFLDKLADKFGVRLSITDNSVGSTESTRIKVNNKVEDVDKEIESFLDGLKKEKDAGAGAGAEQLQM